MRFQKRILVATLIVSLSLSAAPLSAAVKAVSSPPAGKKPGVVAVVNGAEISVDTFNGELLRMERALLDTGKPLTATRITKLRTEVAEGLIAGELLYQESKKKVQVTDAEIAAELEKLKGQYPSEADFTAALNAMKITPASLRIQVERTVSMRKFVDTQFVSKVIVADQDIRSYYDGHRDNFRQPEQVRASYILIKVDPQWNEAKKAEAKRKIDDMRKKAVSGEDFTLLARTYSEDATAQNGGDLGYVRRGQLLNVIDGALFALKPEEVSDVVETRTGYHLVKAVERKPETAIPFEQVKDQLRTLLKQEKGQQSTNASIAKVRQNAKVEIFLPPEE
jgi:peptidyl-prolyl cis-trans isomerase C